MALPLLHFLRQESKPFQDVVCKGPVDVGNWKWWGLDEFNHREIRKNLYNRFASYVCYLQLCIYNSARQILM